MRLGKSDSVLLSWVLLPLLEGSHRFSKDYFVLWTITVLAKANTR